jgi:asparagine synthase (glutamine-hydrolysing)
MCGILGIVGTNIEKYSNNLDTIKQSLAHRGPDNASHYLNRNILLVHNRLSIIDLDKRSNQPMFDNEKNNCVIFNGEIYNYIELKSELSSKYNFKTNSDTEVLLAAYSIWGHEMLHKLKGAFAFCIYNLKNKSVFMARDRFGQKPLYYSNFSKTLIFSSEVKGIISTGYKAEPNLKIWKDYLSNGSTDNSRETFFKNIFQLKPGEMATYKSGEFKVSRWYHLENHILDIDRSNIKNELLKIFNTSVQLNLRADVPIAISLSGGLDSNILMALSQKNYATETNSNLFSVQFEGFSENNLINESTKKYNTKSNFVNFTKNDLLNIFEPITWSLESPSGGLMNCGLAKLSQRVRNEKFKILLDGTGLDEGFGGYEIHHLKYLNSLRKMNKKTFENHLKMFSKNWNISIKKIIDKLDNLNVQTPKTIDGYDLTNQSILGENLIENEDIIKDTVKSDSKVKNFDDIKQSLITYIQETKVPRNNRLKDRISMAQGVELRLPFLEHDLLEFALSIDTKAYFLNGKSKSILRYISKDLLDKKVRLHKKISIQSPQNEWLKSRKIKNFIDDIINSKKFIERGIFDKKKVDIEWKNFLNGKFNTSFFIWQIISTEIWFNVFIDKNVKNIKKNFVFE